MRLAYTVLPQTVPLTQSQVKTSVTPPPQPHLINPDVPTPGSLSMNSTNHPNAWNSAYKFWTSQKYLPKGGKHEGIGELALQCPTESLCRTCLVQGGSLCLLIDFCSSLLD